MKKLIIMFLFLLLSVNLLEARYVILTVSLNVTDIEKYGVFSAAYKLDIPDKYKDCDIVNFSVDQKN